MITVELSVQCKDEQTATLVGESLPDLGALAGQEGVTEVNLVWRAWKDES